MTERYAHLAPAHIQNAVQSFDRVFAGALPPVTDGLPQLGELAGEPHSTALTLTEV